jgi:NAD(P)-dependent dehydrogenase (short-subunit alcohol dehydrogenase family)
MGESSTDRLAIVTGTSAGIGEAVARDLVARDWTVVGIARRPSPLTHPSYHHLRFDLASVTADAADLEGQLAPLLGSGTRRRIGLVNNAAAAEGLMPVARLDPAMLARVYAVNVIAPVWLMGLVMRASPRNAAVRIVNVSSGAATTGFPGLAAYGSAKAALRLAGMSLASEFDSAKTQEARRDAAILSYEPGVVETDMQRYARSRSPEEFPWVSMFQDFAARGLLVPAERPAAEIVAFLESDGQAAFAERRLRS